jgi:hypothetical protein
VIACQDAWRRLPWAEVMYGCDDRWWNVHEGCPDFRGEKWSAHGDAQNNDKREVARKYGVRLLAGAAGRGFSYDPCLIHYGDNSGFQTLNLAILMCHRPATLVLVGFNMGGPGHFFGDHPPGLTNQQNYAKWVHHFDKAAKTLPPDVKIINSTPDSMLKCFPFLELEQALEHDSLHRNGTVADVSTGRDCAA